LNLRQGCGERNALGRGLIEKYMPDGLIVLMLPKQRERILELHAQRLDNIPCAIRNGACCKPADNALFAVNGFDIKNRVCAIKFHVFSPAFLEQTDDFLNNPAISLAAANC
jgi:hypothetical protein